MTKFTRYFSITPFILLTALIFLSCKDNTQQKLLSLKQKADSINSDFFRIRREVDTLSTSIRELYVQQRHIIPSINTTKYQLAKSGVLYKPLDDGGSAVFVSGYYPINDNIKQIVYFTEPIDSAFKKLVRDYPEIVQVYYNDQFSINRIYPFFDVLSQYEAKINIPGFNFYYLADIKHNPDKKSLWVHEPYVDPAGRGWMVSAIAPVYFEDQLVGVPGIDVTINTITKRYVKDGDQSLDLIIDHSGGIVTAQETSINLLSFPPLYEHKYIETIKQDTYRKEKYNISLSKDLNVRTMANEILKNKKEVVKFEVNGEKLTVISAHISELDWYLLEIIR